MDITKLSIIDLKALAYDELVLIEQSQKNIVAINSQINIKSKELAAVPVSVPPVSGSPNG